MAANSGIEWTDRSWQVTAGCLHRSPGCAHCYAESMAYRLACMAQADIAEGRDPKGKRKYLDVIDLESKGWNGRVVPAPEALGEPFTWRKPQMVFVDSMSDLFFGDAEDEKRCRAKGIPFEPVPFDFIDRVFCMMALNKQHTYQVLTKRAERLARYFTEMTDSVCSGRVRDMLYRYPRYFPQGPRMPPHIEPDDLGMHWPLPNVWIGCSAEDQKQAIIRHRSLIDVPAAVRFWSLEPLLGPIDALPLKGIHWIIVGGESGPGARPCYVEWIRDIIQQCREAGVACFVKQLGSLVLDRNGDQWPNPHGLASTVTNVHYGDFRRSFAHKKAGDPAEWAPALNIREYPNVEATL